ncbi:hypothetical protein T265_13508, partial [Opisthorchis viverrini]
WWESYHSSWTILLFPWCSARSEVNQHNHINPRSRFFHTTVYAKPGHRFTWAILETTDSTYSDQYVRFDCQRNGSEHHGVWLRKPIVTTVEPLSMQVQMCNPYGGPISLQLQLTLPQTQQSGWKMSTSIPMFFHTTVYAKPGHRFTWAILETTDSTYSDQYVRFDCQRNGSEHHGVWLRKPIVTTVEPLSMQVQMCNPYALLTGDVVRFNAASVLNSGDYLDTVIEMAPNFCATDPTKAGQMAFASDIQI